MYGFSYCGIHCSEFGVEYIPDAKTRMLNQPKYKINDETVTNRHGSYYYNNNVQPREFSLDCFFEKQSEETIEKIYQWLHRDTEGRLIFDDRPYVYYDVRPSKLITGAMYPTSDGCSSDGGFLWSGTLTICLTAFEQPFGKMLYTSYETDDTDEARYGTGIMPSSEMPPAVQNATGTYLLYNPGTEECDTRIRIAGSAPNGQTIINHTTGDRCHLLAVPGGLDYLEIDSEAGSVRQSSTDFGLAFEYHDEGYIRLAPCTPYHRNAVVHYESGSDEITVDGVCLTDSFIGRYLRLNNSWFRIIHVKDATHATISQIMDITGKNATMIVVMNEISIEGTGAEITKLDIEYTPLVR